jgi:hypothetical protein
MFPNTAGSSEHNATGTPWFNSTGNGCMGIDDVKRCPQPLQYPFVGIKKKSYQNFIPKTIDERFGTPICSKSLTKLDILPPQCPLVYMSPPTWGAW